MFRSYSSVDFGTKKVVKEYFKHEHSHPEGEATTRPIITGARPFLRNGKTLGICFFKKRKIDGGGCTVYTSFSPSILLIVWRRRPIHVCIQYVRVHTYSRQFSKRGEVGLRGLYRNVLLSPLVCVHCHVQSWSVCRVFTVIESVANDLVMCAYSHSCVPTIKKGREENRT